MPHGLGTRAAKWSVMNFESLSFAQLESTTGGGVDPLPEYSNTTTCDLSSLPRSGQNLLRMDVADRATPRELRRLNYAGTSCDAQLHSFQNYTLGRYGSYAKATDVKKAQGWY